VNQFDDANNGATDVLEAPRKRKYVNWFGSEFIHDILHAHSICKTGYKTVQYLRKQFPKLPTQTEGRFEHLNLQLSIRGLTE
jgi:hypothetical protein